MRALGQSVAIAFLMCWVAMIDGCGGGSSSQSVTVTFTGDTPLAVAIQVEGTGAFTAMTPSNQITFQVPPGNVKFAIAFVCPRSDGIEFVIQATTQDSTSFGLQTCPGLSTSFRHDCSSSAPEGHVTISVSSSIPGTASMMIDGNQRAFFVNGTSGSVTGSMLAGDIAVTAGDASGNVIGAKILRSQTVPGTITVPLGAADTTASQQVTVTNSPSGFLVPLIDKTYNTVNCTQFQLGTVTSNRYAVVPPASTQAGDFYTFSAITFNNTTAQRVVVVQNSTSADPINLALPAPWSFSGPTQSKFPTFDFAYSGFNGQQSVEADLLWFTGDLIHSHAVVICATANFQNGATSLSIPDLTSLSGFVDPAPTGTPISWHATINSGALPMLLTDLPADGSIQFVERSGLFTAP